MWRLIAFILICAIFLAFVTLNLENKSDVSFGFRTFNEIPVFLTAFSSFVLGMLFAIPFVLSFGRKRRKAPPEYPLHAESPPAPKKTKAGKTKPCDKTPYHKAPDYKTSDEKAPAPPAPDEVKKERSPYGID